MPPTIFCRAVNVNTTEQQSHSSHICRLTLLINSLVACKRGCFPYARVLHLAVHQQWQNWLVLPSGITRIEPLDKIKNLMVKGANAQQYIYKILAAHITSGLQQRNSFGSNWRFSIKHLSITRKFVFQFNIGTNKLQLWIPVLRKCRTLSRHAKMQCSKNCRSFEPRTGLDYF